MAEFNGARLNRMLSACLKDMAQRPLSRAAIKDHRERDLSTLQKSLGLYPFPPRTDLKSQSLKVFEREGYRIEKLIFESRPNVPVPAHLYLPDSGPPTARVIYAPDVGWSKSTPWVQSAGIGFALLGFACLIVDPPGSPERADLGDLDWSLQSLGVTAQGQYVWDLIRALDYFEAGLPAGSTGVTGAGFGGYAAAFAFACDSRFEAGALASCLPSLEALGMVPADLRGLSQLLKVGDLSDCLNVRHPAPVDIISYTEDSGSPPLAIEKTADKVRECLRLFKSEKLLRTDSLVGGRDFNRRARESAYAFFDQHLRSGKAASYVDEPRPLTDGKFVSHPAGTEPEDAEELRCRAEVGGSDTFERQVWFALEEPYPERFDAIRRLIPWAKYGQLPSVQPAEEVIVSDTKLRGAIVLPVADVDQDVCVAIGLSVPEFFGQVLHQMFPGGPEGWEQTALTGHALTSMFASVKTLVAGGREAAELKTVRAVGPVASVSAQFLKLLRPSLVVHASHRFTGWSEMAKTGVPQLCQPGARYLAWPFDRSTQTEPIGMEDSEPADNP